MKEGYGEFIKKHRLLNGFKSQRKFAEKTGISPATISRIESEIQKPEISTLKCFSQYLDTTSYVELMVACGYWGEEELIAEDMDRYFNPPKEKKDKEITYKVTERKKNKIKPSNEEEFINKIDLSNEEITDQFDLRIDGRSLTESETKGIIAYIRSLRSMNS